MGGQIVFEKCGTSDLLIGIFALAGTDPVGFLAGQPKHVAIDEFQRGGNELLLALKAEIDRSDDRGQYLLAGSTRFLSTRTLAETLTGRVGLTELLPVSMGEWLSVHETFLDGLFATDLPTPAQPHLVRSDYAELVAQGGASQRWCWGPPRTDSAPPGANRTSAL